MGMTSGQARCTRLAHGTTYIGLPITQGVLAAHPAAHQQPAALICAADIWKACNTSSRSIGVIFGVS